MLYKILKFSFKDSYIIKKYFSTLEIREVYRQSYKCDDLRNKITKHLSELQECVPSLEEAICLFKAFLKNEYFDAKLYRSCINIIENEYFKPMLTRKDGVKAYDLGIHHINNIFKFINNLSIKDKSLIVLDEYHHLNDDLNKKVPNKPIESVDPEKEEVYVTKKVGKVLNPKPIRAKIRMMSPGKKLSNLIALQLRESISNSKLTDLCFISLIFSKNLPLTGQLNEDTIELLSMEISKFTPEEISKQLLLLSQFCHAAIIRFNEIWSFNDPNVNRLPNFNKCLYKIHRRKLNRIFIDKIVRALEIYANEPIQRGEGISDNFDHKSIPGLSIFVPINGVEVLSDERNDLNCYEVRKGVYIPLVTSHLIIMRNISYSDLPISLALWDKLVHKLRCLLSDEFDINPTILSLYCESVNVMGYTSHDAISLGIEMLNKTDINSIQEYDRTLYILKFAKDHDPGGKLREILNTNPNV